jgi:hypothetical protein
MGHRTRIMWIEPKVADLAGPARIGRVTYSKSRASISYRGQGFKANYFDVDTGDEYWISGCHRDGMDALYSTTAEVDDDVLEEYWVGIRGRPDLVQLRSFRAAGKW